MNNFQKWIVTASLIFSLGMLLLGIGTILNSVTKRYRWAELYDVFAQQHPHSRYDTWTGDLQVRHSGRWESGASSWIKKLG